MSRLIIRAVQVMLTTELMTPDVWYSPRTSPYTTDIRMTDYQLARQRPRCGRQHSDDVWVFEVDDIALSTETLESGASVVSTMM